MYFIQCVNYFTQFEIYKPEKKISYKEKQLFDVFIIFHSLKEINLKKYDTKKSSLFNVLIIFHCLKEIKTKLKVKQKANNISFHM